MKLSWIAAASALILAGCGGSGYSASRSGSTGSTASPFTSEALAINDHNVAVGYSTDSTNQKRAVLFLPNGATAPTLYTIHDIGTLGGSMTHVYAINASGQCTGWSYDASSVVHGFFYSGGTLHDTEILQGDSGSMGLGLNDNGVLVGESYNLSTTHPYRWDLVNGYQQVHTPDGQSNGVLTGINNSGVMVGSYLTSTFEVRTFLALMDNTTYDLKQLAGVLGVAKAINNNAYIVGDDSPTGGWWFQDVLPYTPLPNHGGINHNPIYAVNNNQVIVGADLFGTHLHAVSYTTSGTERDLGVLGDPNVVDLNTLISASDLQTVGRLIDATGMNATGQICCNTQTGHAVILTPASP